MLPMTGWTIFYADGSTVAHGCPEGCTDHTKHVDTLAEANPFGVTAHFRYDVDGRTLRECGNDRDSIVVYEDTPEGSTEICLMGLWTDGESYWRVHDLARREYTP